MTIALDAIAQNVPAGHRLRVALSTAYWPWVWPTAEPVTLALHAGRLALPTRAPRAEELPAFGPPEWSAPLEVERIEPGRTNRTHTHDPATGAHELRFEWDVGGHRRRSTARSR